MRPVAAGAVTAQSVRLLMGMASSCAHVTSMLATQALQTGASANHSNF